MQEEFPKYIIISIM